MVSKVICGPYVVTIPYQMPTFEAVYGNFGLLLQWTQKDMCLVEIELCAQNILTILGSIANTLERPL